MLKDKVILVNVIIMISLLTVLVHVLLLHYVVNNGVVEDTTVGVTSDSAQSVKLTEGYDRRVQWSVPGWALHTNSFDDVELVVN